MARTSRLPTRRRPIAIAVLAVGAILLTVLNLQRLLPTRDPAPERDPGAGPTTTAVPQARALPSEDSSVVLPVGADLQAIIDKHPPGTTYRLESGRHRLEDALRPKTGDTFVGEPGTVLSGARDISADAVDWRRGDHGWYVEGQTQEADAYGELRDDGNPHHTRPEMLFVEDRLLEHVENTQDLEPGRWHFDYGRDRIWVATDPGTLGRIETTVSPGAFIGEGVDNVMVANVTVEKHANRSSHGAINGLHAYGWQIRDCTARLNHGAGVSVGPGGLVEGCDLHHNGQLGLKVVGIIRRGERTGDTGPATIRGNRIHHNRVLDFDWSWEAGALKIQECQGVLFEQNWVHDNDGPGPWFDVYNYQATIRDNVVERNAIRGIFYELSYGPTAISDNVVRNNGAAAGPERWGSGIFISNSRDVEVTRNVVYGNSGGGINARNAGHRDPLVWNLRVHGNDIEFAEGYTGLSAEEGAPADTFSDMGNRFDNNRYFKKDASTGFAWDGELELSWTQWQQLGNDVSGSLTDAVESMPTPETDITRRRFGPQG